MANHSTSDPLAFSSSPLGAGGGAHPSANLPTSSFGHEYPAELAFVSLALLVVIALMLVAIGVLLVCCCLVLRRARRPAASRVPPQIRFRRGPSNTQTTAAAIGGPADAPGPSNASLLPHTPNGAPFETTDPTDPSLEQNNGELSTVQINMEPEPEPQTLQQNHVAQTRLERVFDECDPERTDRVKCAELREALLANGFAENFVDHLGNQLERHDSEYVTKSAFDECLNRLPNQIFISGEDVPTEAILRVWDELCCTEEATSDAESAQERPVANGLPLARPVRGDEFLDELRHRGISEQFIQSYIGEPGFEVSRDELAAMLARYPRKQN